MAVTTSTRFRDTFFSRFFRMNQRHCVTFKVSSAKGFVFGTEPRCLLGERIANTETGESGKVAVDCPEFLDSVFDRECCDMGIMDKVA